MSGATQPSPDYPPSALAFLRRHGPAALVSLGCGSRLNRIDNHLRLLTALNLTFYVGIDRVAEIEPPSADIFSDRKSMETLLAQYFQGRLHRWWEAIKVFPNTWVEEVQGLPCAAVVCQRVWPYCRWEEIIVSMRPQLVLQEDLHGCERQQLRGRGYVRAWLLSRQYRLQPFRPWPIFPGERNLVLWRRQDFADEPVQQSRWRILWRLRERFIG